MPGPTPLAGDSGHRCIVARVSLRGAPRVALGIAERPERTLAAREVAARLDKDGEPRIGVVSFQVAEGEEPGRLHVVDVVEHDAGSDHVVGGLTFVVRAR